MYQLCRLYKGKVIAVVSEGFSSYSEANSYRNFLCRLSNDFVSNYLIKKV